MFTFRVFLYTLLAMCSFGVHADQANLNMTGTVSTSCAFTGQAGGVLAVSPSNPTFMSTATQGGSPATANLSYTGTPTLTVTEITSFDSVPSGFNPTLGFSNQAQSQQLGNMSYSSGSASGQYIGGSADILSINLGVTSSAPFATGNYSASTTVTCQ